MSGTVPPRLEHGFDMDQALLKPAAYLVMNAQSLGTPAPFSPVTFQPATLEALKVACSNCNLRELCLPVTLADEDMQRLDSLVDKRRAIKRGETLFRAGDAFSSIYAVRTGFFKTCITAADGRDQVTGFLMAGELLGFDGIGTDRHACDAVALEDSQVCVIPFSHMEALSREFTPLQRQFHRIMSREIVRDQGVMLLLGSMRAEERLSAFLLNLVRRLHSRGFSSSELVLRMTREEIGSYLGLTLETVSRTFSKLQEDGVLQVHNRHVRISREELLRPMLAPGGHRSGT